MRELESLVAEVRAGQLGAYTEIVRRFQDMAVGYAHALLGDFHLAEDAAQEAFLQAYLDLAKLDQAAAFPGWFRRIVFKSCDRIRRKKSLHAVPLDDWALATPERGPAAQLETGDAHQQLLHAIRCLPAVERTVTTLFYISQFPQFEIAAFLEVPEATINNRLHRARRRLREELVQMGALKESRPSKDEAFAGRVREHLEALKLAHEKLVPNLKEVFSQALDQQVQIEVASVNHTICVEVVQFFGNPSATYTFIPKEGQGRIIIDLGVPLMAALVGRDLGTVDALRAADLNRIQMQSAEIDRLNPIMRSLLEYIIGAWEGVMDMQMLECMLETNPIAIIANPKHKVLEPEDPVFHVLFEVTWDDYRARLDVAYPSASLAAALEKLSRV